MPRTMGGFSGRLIGNHEAHWKTGSVRFASLVRASYDPLRLSATDHSKGSLGVTTESLRWDVMTAGLADFFIGRMPRPETTTGE